MPCKEVMSYIFKRNPSEESSYAHTRRGQNHVMCIKKASSSNPTHILLTLRSLFPFSLSFHPSITPAVASAVLPKLLIAQTSLLPKMANQASRATSLAPEQGPSALAAAATILMPIQASGLAATAAPAAIHNKGIYVDLTADDSESGGDVVAPTPAPTPAPAPVHYVDSDDEVVVLPPPRVREERARAGTQTGNIRLSITACKDAASSKFILSALFTQTNNIKCTGIWPRLSIIG